MDSDREIEALYHEFRDEFLRNTARYPLSEESRIDIYQDAFVALYDMIMFKKKEIKTGYKNYLFGIGRNMIIDKIKLEIKEREFKDELLSYQHTDDLSYNDTPALNPMQEMINEALGQISESCRKLLVLFYFRQYSIEAIMHSMNYANENVTKSNKSRCLKGLKQLVKNK